VIAIGGEDRTSVSMGIIASLIQGEVIVGEEVRPTLVSGQTNISGSIPGSPIVNIFGEVVGIDLQGIPGLYTASPLIREALNAEQSAASEGAVETASEELDKTLES
jgi:hypothetical protein